MACFRTPHDSPLAGARRALGLILSDTAKDLGCSEGAVSRYLAGSGTTPLVLFVLLGNRDLRVRHEQWLERTGRRRPRGAVTIEVVAKRPAGRAIADFIGGAR
jgi:transcriptional regulator with XRE-family HTH domain